MKLNVQNLLVAMAKECMTITELSQKSKVSRVALTRFTNSKCSPKPITVGKIAKALDVSVEYLVQTEGERHATV